MQSLQSVEIQADLDLQEKMVSSTVQCSNLSPAVNFCFNSNCKSYVFLCGDRKCQCYKQHKGCAKGSIDSISQAIQEKLKSIEPFKNKINELINASIDQLSKFGQRIIDQAGQELNYIGLTENERKFLKAIKKNKTNELSSRQMNEALLSIDDANGFNKKMKHIENYIDDLWDNFNRSMKDLFQKVQSRLEIFTGSTKLHFAGSSIIKTEEQKQNLLKFFNQKVLQPQLLYRASENNFSTQVFFSKCKNINHTLVICETQYGKIIGGYNHKIWRQGNNNGYNNSCGDETKKSFVFSLTNNDKFSLQSLSYAIQYRPGFGPIFSNNKGTDFGICNKAHTQKKSLGNINFGYFNPKYTRENQSSLESFSGSQDQCQFLVKEWQVWQVNFEQNLIQKN